MGRTGKHPTPVTPDGPRYVGGGFRQECPWATGESPENGSRYLLRAKCKSDGEALDTREGPRPQSTLTVPVTTIPRVVSTWTWTTPRWRDGNESDTGVEDTRKAEGVGVFETVSGRTRSHESSSQWRKSFLRD